MYVYLKPFLGLFITVYDYAAMENMIRIFREPNVSNNTPRKRQVAHKEHACPDNSRPSTPMETTKDGVRRSHHVLWGVQSVNVIGRLSTGLTMLRKCTCRRYKMGDSRLMIKCKDGRM